MGFMTKKREVDLVSIFAIATVSVLLTFFVSWLFYSSKVDKMKSSYDFKVELIKGKIDYLQDKNKILEDKLARIKEFVKTDEESGKAPEEK